MARPHAKSEYLYQAKLDIQKLSKSKADVYLVPSDEWLDMIAFPPEEAQNFSRKILTMDGKNDSVQMFPICTLFGKENFLDPKYDQIKSITIVGDHAVYVASSNTGEGSVEGLFTAPTFGRTKPLREELSSVVDSLDLIPSSQQEVEFILQTLPSVFTKNYIYGLGFAQKYRYIVNAIESLTNCTGITIQEDIKSGIKGTEFVISLRDLETARKSINRAIAHSHNATDSVNTANIYNLFAARLNQPSIPVRTGRSSVRKLLTEAAEGKTPLVDNDQDLILELMASNSVRIVKNRPKKLIKLKDDIELVRLKNLIEEFKNKIKKEVSERDWQSFLTSNAFALSLVFGQPFLCVRGQAYVGGRNLDLGGSRLSDFFMKNNMTDNVGIIEIKTPKMSLLAKSPYRNGVFSPSSEFSGALSQILDQKSTFEQSIAQIKHNSGIQDIESYSIRCALIAGTIPIENSRKRSLELFRGNFNGISVITFDELLNKIENLQQFLTNGRESKESIGSSDDIPFRSPI